MQHFHIRDLFGVAPVDFLTEYPKRFVIEFDNGVKLEVSRKRTYVSAFYWRVFRDFPDSIVHEDCHIDSILGTKKLQSSTHAKVASNVFKAVVRKRVFVKPEEREIIQHHLQRATNDLYNGLRWHSGRHLQSIGLIDCLKLMYHPVIWEAVKNCPETPRGVEQVYKTIQKVIETDPDIQNNDMVKAVRAGAVKFNQVCQSIGVRGFPKEVNGRIYRTLARSNYLFGMVNLYEFAADSRGSAEHLSATESPLQDSEYFSRRLQLQTCILERVAYEDCGTTQTIPFFVRPAGKIEETGEDRQCDLKFLVGKMYICPKTGELKMLDGSEKHLIGTTIQLRSVLTCEHADPHAVCQVCFGALSNNHSRWANVGVVASTTVVSKISQKTLSTKHHISSGQGSGIVFDNMIRLYFTRGPKNTDYVLRKELAGQSIQFVVSRDSALGLVDVMNSESIDTFNPERITGITEVRFIAHDKKTGNIDSNTVKLEQGKRVASMSMKMLEYVRENGYSTDERNNFVIDLKDWDYDNVAFTLPDIQVSFSAHGSAIAELIESKFEHLAERSSDDAPLRVLLQFFDMVTPKLPDVNIATLECIVYGLQQASVGNYSMARGSSKPIMGIGKDLIWNRSLGTAMAYQEWNSLFLNPRTYQTRNKPSTMMDVFIDPVGYLTHHSKTYVHGNYQRKLRGEL